jgi:hypothetical protein
MMIRRALLASGGWKGDLGVLSWETGRFRGSDGVQG